jgi:hypothetical protein
MEAVKKWATGLGPERCSSMRMKSIIATALMFAVSLVLISCHRNYGVLRDEVISRPRDSEIKSTLVFFIHGDGSYSYHDQKGKRFEADAVILQQAMTMAKNSPRAEVFIFHQKPKRKWLFLFDRPDGSFYYFRNGAQLAGGSYHRRSRLSVLDSESEIIKTYHAPESEERVSGFLYFGHALAELDDKSPRQSMNVRGLAQGLSCLLSEVDPNVMKFDLVVLSACYSGTPGIIAELAHYSRYILASPDDLHLAYLDIQPLRRLNSIGFSEVHSLAREMASQSLVRLQKWTQTSIALAVYDVERIAPFLEKVQSRQAVGIASQSPNSPQPVKVEYCDCLDKPFTAAEIPSAGVEVYYQPPHFGRLKNKTKHSGWSCWEAASK